MSVVMQLLRESDTG